MQDMKRTDGIFILGLLLLAMNLTAQEGQVIQEGLVGHWSFDDLDSRVFDDHSQNPNNCINYGGVLVDGMKGKALYFDAANSGLIIEVGHSPVHSGSERLYFTIWKNGCTYPSFCFDSNDAISTGQWHHIVVVVDENTSINIASLPPGLYVARSGESSKKFLVQE